MTVELDERSQTTDTGNDDDVFHIVSKHDWGVGYIMGQEIEALCGKRWVPSRDPQGLEPCQACASLLEQLHGADAAEVS